MPLRNGSSFGCLVDPHVNQGETMSWVVELQRDWMKDPAFVQEFARLEAEARQVKSMAQPRIGPLLTGESLGAHAGVVMLSSRKRSA